ncbi:MAG: DUF362 domain-containing protein [Chloroflexi bacterium]|nr:DUF362 domain-containing protein [Chloroflexota bacterium]
MEKFRPKLSITRRRFLRQAVGVGSLVWAAPLLNACAQSESEMTNTVPTVAPQAAAPSYPTATTAPPQATPTASPPPTPTVPPATATPLPTVVATSTVAPTVTVAPTEDPGIARVAFVKTRNRAEGVRQALALLGINPVKGKNVVLKPNLNSADPAPGSTHPDVLQTLIQELWVQGATAITLVDRSGMGDTRQTMEQKGVFSLGQKLGFDTLVLDEIQAQDWAKLQPPGSHWQKGFAFARPCLECDALVQTCCLKTHRFGGHFTLSLKNSVGMAAKYIPGDSYNYMQELHASPNQRLMIAEINTAYTPALIVLDGVEAFVNGGPDTGKRVWSEVVLAGTDRAAIDAVGVALLRHFGTTPEVSKGPIFGQEQIARAVELGLGVDKPKRIRLVTGDPESAAYAAEIEKGLRG